MNVLAILKDFTLRCKSIFENTTTKMSKRFVNWLILTIRTVALIPGKVNFTRLSRYGGRTAKTFAANFGTHIDWLKINQRLALEAFHRTDDVAIAIDPSYISKAGKLTYGMGKFWSGIAQRVKRGLEIMAIGAISLSQHCCVMLGAVQTPSSDLRRKADDASMIEWYLSLTKERKDELLAFSRTIVVDAFFSAFDFVDGITALGFNFVGRLKDNAYLRYLAVPDPYALKRRGRRTKYGHKVDFSNPDMSIFKSFIYTDSKGVCTQCCHAVVHSRALKRDIRIVICPGKDAKTSCIFHHRPLDAAP